MSYIDRIKVGNTTHLIEPTLYAECTTAAATATKQTAAINNFNLVAGVQVAVKFTVTNTAAVSDLKLQIGTTTAKSIKYRGGNLPSIGTLAANHIYNFIYDGTNWELVGDLDTNTNNAVTQSGNAEDKTYPILFKNTDNTTDETAGVKYSNNISATESATKPFTYNPNTGILKVPKIQISIKDDSFGFLPYANNWNSLGASNLYWYRVYGTNYYGTRSSITNWDAGKNIGTAATSSAAATKGSVYFYNTTAANGTQTKTLLDNNANTNSNITVTLPSSTGTLALTSDITTAIQGLDVNEITNTAGKTVNKISETDGKIAISFQDISITKSQVSDFAHTHSHLVSLATINSGDSENNTHAAALKKYFDDNKSTVPRNSLVNFYSSAYGNGSQAFGYWLSSYDNNPYGGFFVAHYNTPRYVGILNGTYTQVDLITSGTIRSQSVNYANSAGTATSATTAGAFSSGTTVKLTGDTTGESSSSTKGWSVSTTTKYLSGTAEAGLALTTAPGTGKIRYSYNVNTGTTGLFDTNNNANSIITINRNNGNYDSQLGFSANGNIYYRSFNGTALNATTAWKQLAFIDSTVARATADASGNTITSTYAPLASPTFTGTPKAPTAANGTSTTQIATTEFVNNTLAYANAMTFKGTLGTGGTITALPASHNAGDTYRVITAGTWAGKYCEIGTLIICTTDGTAANDAHWTSVETNEDGAVIGATPTSSTDNAIVRWDGTSGRIIQNSGVTIDDGDNIILAVGSTAITNTNNKRLSWKLSNGTMKGYFTVSSEGKVGIHGCQELYLRPGDTNNAISTETGTVLTNSAFYPYANEGLSLGLSNRRWTTLYAATNIFVGNSNFTAYNTNNQSGVCIGPEIVSISQQTAAGARGFWLIGNGQKDYARLYINTLGTASTAESSSGANDGTQGAVGDVILILGNAIARGAKNTTDGLGNARGRLRLHGTTTNYIDLYTQDQATNGRAIFLPNSDHANPILIPSYDLSGAQDLNTKYNAGIYCIEGGSVTNYPSGSTAYANLLVLPCRRPQGNTKPDFALQIYGNSVNRLWFRGSDSNNWRAWRELVHVATNTGAGSANTPVYIDTDGTVTAVSKYLATHISGGSEEIQIKYSTTIDYWWGVGTGNENHGLYDNKAGKWILLAGTNNDWSFDGNANSATSANYINLYETRGTTTTLNKAANYVAAGAMFHLVASSSTSATDNGKTPTDANILQMNWDNNGGYDAQLGIATGVNRMYFRARPSLKTAWDEVAHAPVGTTGVGNSTQPVYMTSEGVITACTSYANASVNYATSADSAKWLMNRGTNVTIGDSAWAHGVTGRGGTNTSGGTVWKQKWTQSGLTYTPSGGSATTLSDSGDLVIWLSQNTTSNNLWANMAIDGYVYSLSGFRGGGLLVGKSEINQNVAAGANSDLLRITNTRPAANIAANNWFWGTDFVVTNMIANTNACHVFGKANSTKNSGVLNYHHAGDASNDNYAGLGLYGVEDILTTYANRTVQVNGKLCLNRVGSASYGRISYYKSNFVTWFTYMSDTANGAAPTGGKPSTLGNITSWGLRTLIENASGYGWLWEAATNSAASANTVEPTVRMGLSSNTGQLRIAPNASSTSLESGGLIIDGAKNASSGNVAIELWRGGNASWQIANESGNLYIRNNWTTTKQTTYNRTSIIVNYNTGNTTFAGSVTATGGFSGNLSGNATSASKISAKLAATTKTYLLGTATAITATAANVEITGDTGVYLTTTAGELSAVRHSWNVSGTEKAYTTYNSTDDSLDFVFI